MQKLRLEWLDLLKSPNFTKKTWFQVCYFVIYFAVTLFYYFYFSNGGIWENTANFKGDSALSLDDKWVPLSVAITFFSYFIEKQLNCSFLLGQRKTLGLIYWGADWLKQGSYFFWKKKKKRIEFRKFATICNSRTVHVRKRCLNHAICQDWERHMVRK